MIEKEAKELFNKKPLGYEMKPELEIYTDGFKDGYNKAKEEMQKNGLALQSDMDKTIEQNILLKDKLKNLASVAEVRLANWQKYEKGLKEAKDLIRNLLRVTYDEGWNYSLDVKVKAEDFLKECKEW